MSSKQKIFYTDGACNVETGCGGWSAVELVSKDKGLETHYLTGDKDHTTNNEMELTGVYMALVKSYKEKCKEVTIYSDSAYVVNAVTKGWLQNWANNGWKTKQDKPVKNKHIWEKMYKLIYMKGMHVNFVKVKGHNGDPLNEFADKIAVESKMRAEKRANR